MSKKSKNFTYDITRLKFIPCIDESTDQDVAAYRQFLAESLLEEFSYVGLYLERGRLHIHVDIQEGDFDDQLISLDQLVEVEIYEDAKVRSKMANEFQRLADKLRRGSRKSG